MGLGRWQSKQWPGPSLFQPQWGGPPDHSLLEAGVRRRAGACLAARTPMAVAAPSQTSPRRAPPRPLSRLACFGLAVATVPGRTAGACVSTTVAAAGTGDGASAALTGLADASLTVGSVRTSTLTLVEARAGLGLPSTGPARMVTWTCTRHARLDEGCSCVGPPPCRGAPPHAVHAGDGTSQTDLLLALRLRHSDGWGGGKLHGCRRGRGRGRLRLHGTGRLRRRLGLLGDLSPCPQVGGWAGQGLQDCMPGGLLCPGQQWASAPPVHGMGLQCHSQAIPFTKVGADCC